MDAVKVLFWTTHYFKLGRAESSCGVLGRSQISSLQFLLVSRDIFSDTEPAQHLLSFCLPRGLHQSQASSSFKLFVSAKKEGLRIH